MIFRFDPEHAGPGAPGQQHPGIVPNDGAVLDGDEVEGGEVVGDGRTDPTAIRARRGDGVPLQVNGDLAVGDEQTVAAAAEIGGQLVHSVEVAQSLACLLYTSDAADERSSV